jgi:hypothetical protein
VTQCVTLGCWGGHIQVAFVQTDQVDFVWVLDRMVDITFIFDMMLRFNSAYKDKAGT